MTLCEFPWWPKTWTDEWGRSPDPIELRETAVLKYARKSDDDLIVILEHEGAICTAKIAQLSEDFVILLRHILLRHCGEPISAVENIEVTFGEPTSPSQLFPFKTP